MAITSSSIAFLPTMLGFVGEGWQKQEVMSRRWGGMKYYLENLKLLRA